MDTPKAIIYRSVFKIPSENDTYGVTKDIFILKENLRVRYACCTPEGNTKKLTIVRQPNGPDYGPWIVDNSGRKHYASDIQEILISSEFIELCKKYYKWTKGEKYIEDDIISQIHKIRGN